MDRKTAKDILEKWFPTPSGHYLTENILDAMQEYAKYEIFKLSQAEVVKSVCEHEVSPLFDVHNLEVAKWCLKCGKIFEQTDC